MSETLKVRAGASFRANIKYYTDDSETSLVDTTGYTAHFQVRAVQPPSRVLLDTSDTPYITQVTAGVGEWELFLPKSFVRSLPPSSRFEIELVSDTDAEDVDFVESGIISVTPEAAR